LSDTSESVEPAAAAALEKIHRSRGSTASERLLADLGEQAFLNLWSYPNLFYDKKQGGVGDGKELCDLLVVCGDDVIIFSDKHIKYQEDREVNVAWPRFYRKAIEGAVVQINGANNWMIRYPDKIFTDSACTQKLPIDLPLVDKRRVHGVVVAKGAHTAIQKILNDDSGSFMIMPSLEGQDAINFNQPGFMPFCVGDVNPGGMFIHVFDDVAIKRVLEHLNTITDFTRYLNKRAAYLRSDRLALAHGEEELLANYLNTGIRMGGVYDFELPRKKGTENASVITVQGEWSAYVLSEQYFAKTLADDVSYAWDKLITLFTENLLEGTSVSVLGAQATIGMAEGGLRFMAMESRFSRRMLGEAVGGALRKAKELKQDRYARVIFPSQASADPKLAYVILILAYPTDLEARGGMKRGYEQYREVRAKMLEAYSLGVLHTYRNLNTVVCIGLDAHSSQTGRKGGSEDFYAMRIDEWTPQLEAEAIKAIAHYDILKEERLIKQRVSRDEYPALGEKAAGPRWPKNKPSKSRYKKPKH
jgi:hypothetical protein